MEMVWGLPLYVVVIMAIVTVGAYLACGVMGAGINSLIQREMRNGNEAFTNSLLYRFWGFMYDNHRSTFNRLHVAFWPIVLAIGLAWYVGIYPLKLLYRFLNPDKYPEEVLEPEAEPVAPVTTITKKRRRVFKRAS